MFSNLTLEILQFRTFLLLTVYHVRLKMMTANVFHLEWVNCQGARFHSPYQGSRYQKVTFFLLHCIPTCVSISNTGDWLFCFYCNDRSLMLMLLLFHVFFIILFSDLDDVPRSTQAKALVSPRKRKLPKVQMVPNEFYGVYCLISRSPLKHYKVILKFGKIHLHS